ncbi:inositol phospholipid synthesis protein Scs3p [Rhypophila decipiens]|uniref:Acyl-coenzyme A diphosphatase SCS3 n=1 Tax=Rhypophila decipiens TaxID=261697 RepID=A0AAN6XW71_9PEZI|nr:inositol phospholipid synthesis protein Scs3p [Rhypophila decipiens]
METPPSHRRKTPSQLVANSSPSPRADLPRPSYINNTTVPTERNTPYLPTPTEIALLSLYPILLLFGALFSLVSPETRSAPYDALRHAHLQDPDLAPSYFARKNNLFNVLFVKRGWLWISASFFIFLFTHPATRDATRRGRAMVRWGVVTCWWIFVTQWFFGPAIIDRGFRWSGGKCEVTEIKIGLGEGGKTEMVTAAACKAAGGRWSGGHDISGHVFLLVLGSYFLVQEVGWVAARWSRYLREERSVVMADGAVKGAGVEDVIGKRLGEEKENDGLVLGVLDALGKGGTVAFAVAGLSVWMLLMTAIYFHTWFEKFTGLLVAMAGLYTIYIVPRWIPVVRQVPPNLPELVRTAFHNARTNGDLNYYPTQVALLHVNSVPVRLFVYLPLFIHPYMSTNPAPPSRQRPTFDPFDKPQPGLFIADLSPSHFLVLNKFAIVEEHFILATKEFKWQTDLLEEADLAAALGCIRAYHEFALSQKDGKDEQKHDAREEQQESGYGELFVFFNCGEHSGASQPHRHLQLLPVERMRDGLENTDTTGKRWNVLAESLLDGADVARRLPFKTFAERIHGDVSPKELYALYLKLYQRACDAVLGQKEAEEQAAGEAQISYNLAMTRDVLVVMPRLAEGAEIKTEEDAVVGKLALNGTVLAGTALVKSQGEWDTLRANPDMVGELLGGIGVPSSSLQSKV